MKFSTLFFHLTWVLLFMAVGAFDAWMIFSSGELLVGMFAALGGCALCYYFLLFAKRNNL
jgi:hypothetical protein